jgi:hypothetical protein
MRHSTIRQVPYSSGGAAGPDMMYVVDLYEDEKKVGTKEYPGKSIHYAESAARNWEAGILKNDK